MVWKHLADPSLGAMVQLSHLVRGIDSGDTGPLPDFSDQSCLLLTSDYSGGHRGSRYEVSGFLLTDFESFCAWDNARRNLRARFLPGGRRLSFKGLRDQRQREFLPVLLSLSDRLRGVLVIIATDGDIGSLFKRDEEPSRPGNDGAFEELWQPRVFERVLRVAHFASFVIAGLSCPGQSVLWFTDQDEIAPNDQRLSDFTRLWGHVLGNYLQDRHSLAHVRCGTTACDNGSRQIEDLAAMPDLAAGAVAEYLTIAADEGVLPRSRIIAPVPASISPKTYALHSWIAHNVGSLKRIVIMISNEGQPKQLVFRHLRTHWDHLF